MKVDAAGNVVKAYSLGDFYIPTQGALCPRWPIYMTSAYQGRTFANRLHDQGKDFLCVQEQDCYQANILWQTEGTEGPHACFAPGIR